MAITGRIYESAIRATGARELVADNAEVFRSELLALIAWIEAQSAQLGIPLGKLELFSTNNVERAEIDFFINDAEKV